MNNHWEVAKYIREAVGIEISGNFKLFVCEGG